jgi:hypothetical protein
LPGKPGQQRRLARRKLGVKRFRDASAVAPSIIAAPSAVSPLVMPA